MVDKKLKTADLLMVIANRPVFRDHFKIFIKKFGYGIKQVASHYIYVIVKN